MMSKYFITLFLFLSTSLVAYESLKVGDSYGQLNAKNYMYCTQDSENLLSFDSAFKKDDFVKLNKSNLGYIFKTYWCRLEVKNTSKNRQNLILSNPRPGVDYIDVKTYQKEGVKSFHLGDMVSLKNRSYPSVFSNFELSLEPNESAVVISKYYTVANLELAWTVQDFQSFLLNENLNFILIFSFFGFIFAMMIYKAFIYFYIKDKAYLVYAFLMATILISQASLQGSMHYFLYDYLDYFTISISSSIFTHLFLVLMWLFALYFFDITKKSRFYYPLLFVIAYNAFVTFLYSASYFYADILKLTPLIVLIAFLEALFLLLFSIAMYFQKKAGAGYFLMGHFLYILAIINYILVLDGFTEFSLVARHGIAFGVFLVISFMSLALSARFKALKDQNEKNIEQLQKNKRYTMIGTTISYISHQWKQPLSVMSAQIASINAQIDHAPKSEVSSLGNKVLDLETSLLFMSKTLTSIKELFCIEDADIKKFKLDATLFELADSLKDMLEKKEVSFSYEIPSTLTLYGNKNLFIHAMKNIVQNAIEAFESNTKDRFIKVQIINQTKRKIVLLVLDNAGGVKISPIENILNPNITDKIFGMGIGLSIAKNILESKFKAKINVQNSEIGANFIIEFPKN